MKKTRLLRSTVLLALAAGFAYAQKSRSARPDSDMQEVLDAFASLGPQPIETLTPQEARRQPTVADAVRKVLVQRGASTEPEPGVTVTHAHVPTSNGDIPIHIYTPDGSGPFPVMVYYHGGGFVIADTQTYDASIRSLAKEAQAIMVAVDYRQAPEHPFPVAPEEAYAAYLWTRGHAAEFNGDPRRVAVGGESAGGNLATVVSLMARDRNVAPPQHQLLIYPVVDDDMTRPSYGKHAQAKPLNKPMMEWFFRHYGGNPAHPYALPMKAASLAGLPPATVITAEIDPLQSEGEAYAERLKQDGVPVACKTYGGVTHEFFGMGAVVRKAREAERYAGRALRQAFAA